MSHSDRLMATERFLENNQIDLPYWSGEGMQNGKDICALLTLQVLQWKFEIAYRFVRGHLEKWRYLNAVETTTFTQEPHTNTSRIFCSEIFNVGVKNWIFP